jgi:FtsP/CotA-like multicopper oxidase with cupredoxin domain
MQYHSAYFFGTYIFTDGCGLRFLSSDVVSYDWTIQRLPVNADGFPRSGIAVYPTGSQNWGDSFRPFPGPAIRAFVGDTVNVTVHNAMETEFTSIHFHGVHMKDNVWMDGVPMITECGIAPGGTFSYVWKVTQTGSYWYHSHAGVQVCSV